MRGDIYAKRHICEETYMRRDISHNLTDETAIYIYMYRNIYVKRHICKEIYR